MRLFILLFIPLLSFVGCAPKTSSLNIIHINDHHSHVEEEEKLLTINNQKVYAKVGGFPRVVSKIHALQSEQENTLTLHAGDALQGTIYYTIFKSKIDAQLMNLIEWDAFELGNHEFDDGDSELGRFLSALKTKNIVSANVVPEKGSLLDAYWRPYIILDKEIGKVAILGIDVAQKTKNSSSPSDKISFFNELQTVQRYLKELKEQGIDKIILLSHFGYENDKIIASSVEGIDVIIGGDSHTLMGDFSMVGLQSMERDYPKVLHSANGQPVCIAQAWSYAYLVGSLHVEFDNEGVIQTCKGTPTLLLGESFKQKGSDAKRVDVNATQKQEILSLIKQHPQLQIVPKDKEAIATLSVYKEQIEEKKNRVIGEVKSYLGHNREPMDSYDGTPLALGSEIVPLTAKAFYLKSKNADFALQNAGGVRSGLKMGTLNIGGVYGLLPFSNTLIEIELTGAQIETLFKDIFYAIYDAKSASTGSFPYGYAIRYDIDMNRSDRVYNIEIKNRKNGKWEPLDPTKSYVLVTNSHLTSGKGAYRSLGMMKKVDTYFDYAMSFAQMVEAMQTLTKLPKEEHPIKSFTAK